MESDRDSLFSSFDALKQSQFLRSESKTKWKIAIYVSFSWFTCYHCLVQVSALEETLIDAYNLTDVEFSFFSTIALFFAIFSAFLTPHIAAKLNIYMSLIIAQTILVISQIIWTIGCSLTLHKPLSQPVILLIFYTNRILFGISLGITDVSLISVIDIWFAHSVYSPIATQISIVFLNIGSLSARYILSPIYQLNDELYQTGLVSLSIAVIGLISTLILRNNEFVYRSEEVSSQWQYDTIPHSTHNTVIKLRVSYHKLSQISGITWTIMVYISFIWGNGDTVSSQLSEPLIDKFNMTEWQANLVLSLINVMTIVLSPIVAWIMYKYDYYTYWMIISPILQAVSFFVYVLADNVSADDDDENGGGLSNITAWLIVILFVLGNVGSYGSSFPALYETARVDLISLVNGVNAMMFLSSGMLLTFIFGQVAQVYGDFNGSVLILAVVYILAALTGIRAHFQMKQKLLDQNMSKVEDYVVNVSQIHQ